MWQGLYKPSPSCGGQKNLRSLISVRALVQKSVSSSLTIMLCKPVSFKDTLIRSRSLNLGWIPCSICSVLRGFRDISNLSSLVAAYWLIPFGKLDYLAEPRASTLVAVERTWTVWRTANSYPQHHATSRSLTSGR